MASQRHKKKGGFDFSANLPRIMNAGLLCCIFFNFVAVAWSISRSSPKQVHTTDTVVTNHFFVVTQVLDRVERDFGGSRSTVERVGLEIPLEYHFMIVDGRPMIRYYGQTYRVGDVTSYGRIDSIFPDRIRLDGGSTYIKNTKNPDQSRQTIKGVSND